jgi:hypothetical protein
MENDPPKLFVVVIERIPAELEIAGDIVRYRFGHEVSRTPWVREIESEKLPAEIFRHQFDLPLYNPLNEYGFFAPDRLFFNMIFGNKELSSTIQPGI